MYCVQLELKSFRFLLFLLLHSVRELPILPGAFGQLTGPVSNIFSIHLLECFCEIHGIGERNEAVSFRPLRSLISDDFRFRQRGITREGPSQYFV